VISEFRRALLGALRRRPEHAADLPSPRRATRGEADKRIEAARRRLKATIPRPPD
jgi:hypothetical protein